MAYQSVCLNKMKIITVILSAFFLCGGVVLAQEDFDFSIHKLESGKEGHTLLIIGGIQGDEPGGFNAASLLVTHYKILKGRVWVVPNLNFISIINRTRGLYGDLNRKFDIIEKDDPQFQTIQKIKSIIQDDRVDVILNHHDGSGF